MAVADQIDGAVVKPDFVGVDVIFYCFEPEAMVRWGRLVGYFHRRCKVPSYEFECDDCKNIFTVRLTLAQYEKKDYHCLRCKSKKIKQQITSFQTKTSRKS